MIQQQTKGQYPAPVAALETMLEAAGVDADAACEMEAKGMSKLFGSPVNAALLNVFFLTDNNKRDKGVDGDVAAQSIESVSVIGAGIMGAGIAAANVKRKLFVTINDANKDALGRGVAEVLNEVSYNKKTKKADVKRAVDFAPFVNGTVSPGEVASSDVVIEAIVENLEVKKSVYAKLEPLMREDAIAVVGLGAMLPGGPTVEQSWQMILNSAGQEAGKDKQAPKTPSCEVVQAIRKAGPGL